MQEQRARRMEELKAAMLEMVRQNHPEASPEMQVEIHPDAAIEFFEIGALDESEEEWQKFLASIRTAEPVPVDEQDMPPEAVERLKKLDK